MSPTHLDAAMLVLPSAICRNPHATLQREWLVTNGLGGFASGTVAGALTRRYHGLLIAALAPPLGRTVLVAKLDETAGVNGQAFRLFTNIWDIGVEEPAGCRLLQAFELAAGVPTWTYAFAGCRLTKRVWMEQGANVTYVQYELDPQASAVELSLRALVNYRDFHALVRDNQTVMDVQARGAGLRIAAFPGATPLEISAARGAAKNSEAVAWEADHTWYRNYHLPVERERGYDFVEDHLSAGVCRLTLPPGGSVTVTLAAMDSFSTPSVTQKKKNAAHRAVAHVEASSSTGASSNAGKNASHDDDATDAAAQLMLAADQFLVKRPTPDEPDGHTVIAGYPWFGDWGRDTMISLPGLTLATGRAEIAGRILRTWAKYVDQGMIPNRFPDKGDVPEYNTADATLWYLWAIAQYVRATDDLDTLKKLFPVMQDILAHHRRGTRYRIHVAEDGLLCAGEPGVQLTWMDAKIGDRVITPRVGKPIELSALWYDGLLQMARLARRLHQAGEPKTLLAFAREYEELAAWTRLGFNRFWNAERGCCHDVLDGPHGHEALLRPNQIFAVSLEHSPLPPERQAAVVRACEEHLLTPRGLRSLARGEPGYCARYAGDTVARDEAYHQGTVWGWLLGPFALAHFRVHQDAAAARRFLEPLLEHLSEACVGSISEVFDAEPPFTPGGCFAQAWSVAETLRAWRATQY